MIYGNPETTTGGKALKFYASVRLDIRRRRDHSRTGTEVIGNRTKIKVVKNKVAPPFTHAASSISSTARASRARAPCSIWPSKQAT